MNIFPYYHGHRVEALLSQASSANKFAQLDHSSPSKDFDGLEAFASCTSFSPHLGIFLSLLHFGDLSFGELQELHRGKTIRSPALALK